jgi:hypothetical protein
VPGPRDRPDQPLQPDLPPPGDAYQAPQADQQPAPDHARAADQQRADPSKRWSKDELGHHLQHLWPGHPSSTQADDPDPGNGLPAQDAPPTAAGAQDGGRAPDGHEPRTHDAGRAPGGPDRGPDQPARNFWTERPAFERAWAAHETRWPADQKTPAVDRSRDPAGSWRGDGGQYLTPDQHDEAKDLINRVHEVEDTVTSHLGEAERKNNCGSRLEGLEFRRKGEDRLKEKIAELLETGAPDATPKEVMTEISDAIRYTFCTDPGNYKDAYWDIKGRLQEHGHRMIYSQNHWLNKQYKGINTRWVTPEGQRFEVQFHTPESFCAKQEITHRAYERLRNPLVMAEERDELMAFQQEVSSRITTPEGATKIPNYREKGR